ncbi:MAG: NAD(P)/FAD-dependent oxidoreductase [Thermaurantimonas sp.]|uniref:NAD(P)/FAD-dependent oxidoreductase n=1 Tax=Thermaurantimonas sp. TaxID=2681568 RepID=UPI00391CD557
MSRPLSFWEKDAFLSETDFTIVGSGITGLITALKLSEKFPKARISILERSLIPFGASTRNAGFACFGSPTEILYDIETLGEEAAIRLVTDRWMGIKELLHIIKPYDIDFKFLGGYELFFKGQKKKYEETCTKVHYINELLGELANEVFIIDDDLEELEGVKGAIGAIYTPYEGQLHSGKLILKLIQKAQSHGVVLLNGVEVNNIEKSGNKHVIHSNLGELHTRQAIVCTNGFAALLLPELSVAPKRGQVLVTEPLPQPLEWKSNLHWDEGYYYARNIRENRILLGGARNLDFKGESTDTIEISELIQSELERVLKKHFKVPTTLGIEYRWAGIMGFGPENEKGYLVGTTPSSIAYGVRLSGMGIALAPIIAKKISDLF